MPRRDEKLMKDKRIWERMGRELAALDELIGEIQTDSEYPAVMTSSIWDRLDKLTYYLTIVRGQAEERMARHIPDWSTRTFYPIDREGIKASVAKFRESMKESPNE